MNFINDLPLELVDYILHLSAETDINNSTSEDIKQALNQRLVCNLWKELIDDSPYWKNDIDKTVTYCISCYF